ncbi:hypothetical protein H0H93_011731 [Arthromyces matolae]|nr:hypothetical protein H0H93_011731 [Arthromyces matolae]
MDVVNVFPSPPHFFKLFLRLAMSLLHSSLNTTRRHALHESHFSQADFDINSNSGFFPPHQLKRLPNAFDIWENALLEANEKLSLGDDERDGAIAKRALGEAWRSTVRMWPALETKDLEGDLPLLQRAHMVLSWLLHFYVHSLPPTDDDILVPKSLTIPLVAVSQCLGIAPVLTFADTVLWNCEPIDPNRPLSANNFRIVNLFSGTEDERNFYIASAKAEFRGVEMLRIIEEFHNLPTYNDLRTTSKLSRDLNRLTNIIGDISQVIQSVRPLCDPHVFYFDIRPWFEGSGSRGPTAPKWIYEGIEASDKLDLSGPSAGQSSVMHALDLFLDIDHKLREKRQPAPTARNKEADLGFMERMRRYMPGKHREYLNFLAGTPKSIRGLAQTTPMLREPYDNTVIALKRLRDEHLKIACLYIVSMSRSSARAGCPVSAMMAKLEAGGPVRGTGGNELSVLLKAGRDATRRAVLKTID